MNADSSNATNGNPNGEYNFEIYSTSESDSWYILETDCHQLANIRNP